MISQSILILVVLAAVFISGASLGQMALRLRLHKLERLHKESERKRLAELKKAIHSQTLLVEGVPGKFERRIKSEIDEMLGDIENS